MDDIVLEVTDLTKTFGDFTAVDNVDIRLHSGEIFGFLGPNGAGKTTTIKMLAGLLQPDHGQIRISGHDLSQSPQLCKKHSGYIPDRPFIYEKLTGNEYLDFIASLYDSCNPAEIKKETRRYLELFDLLDWQDHLIEGYSHGMRQKLIMTSILMLNQPLVIVDEPMVGLDPKSARIVKELFKNKAQQGGTIFLSTHSLEIAEELCDRIAIIVQGKIKAVDTIENLYSKGQGTENNLEDIFLQLTGAYELQNIVNALRSRPAGKRNGPKTRE